MLMQTLLCFSTVKKIKMFYNKVKSCAILVILGNLFMCK